MKNKNISVSLLSTKGLNQPCTCTKTQSVKYHLIIINKMLKISRYILSILHKINIMVLILISSGLKQVLKSLKFYFKSVQEP